MYLKMLTVAISKWRNNRYYLLFELNYQDGSAIIWQGTFLKDTKAELKKVVWPTGKQVVNNTVWVLVLVIVISAIVLGFDLLLEKGDSMLWTLISKWIG